MAQSFHERLCCLRERWLQALEADVPSAGEAGTLKPDYHIGDHQVNWGKHRTQLMCCVALASAILDGPGDGTAERLARAVLAGDLEAAVPLADVVTEEWIRKPAR